MMGVKCTFSQHWLERVKFGRGERNLHSAIQHLPPTDRAADSSTPNTEGSGQDQVRRKGRFPAASSPRAKTENRPAPGAHAQPGGALKRERPAEVPARLGGAGKQPRRAAANAAGLFSSGRVHRERGGAGCSPKARAPLVKWLLRRPPGDGEWKSALLRTENDIFPEEILGGHSPRLSGTLGF